MYDEKCNLNFKLNLHCFCKLLDSSSKLRFLCYNYNIKYVCSTREKALTEPQRTRPACHDRAVILLPTLQSLQTFLERSVADGFGILHYLVVVLLAT